ncbi:MAG: hypothetical protein LBT46_07065 [Planctomycetaceae bacterium]|jgi:energy-coupling factor transporter ATP-binding protein EcfA2|nr:hypothetical protein [Planctomycetaceae bacterium]
MQTENKQLVDAVLDVDRKAEKVRREIEQLRTEIVAINSRKQTAINQAAQFQQGIAAVFGLLGRSLLDKRYRDLTTVIDVLSAHKMSAHNLMLTIKNFVDLPANVLPKHIGWQDCIAEGESLKQEIEYCRKNVQTVLDNAAGEVKNKKDLLEKQAQAEIDELQLSIEGTQRQFAKQWGSYLQPLNLLCQKVRESQPSLDKLTSEHLNRTKEFPSGIVFGQWHLSLPAGNATRYEWQGVVPRLIDFPLAKPLVSLRYGDESSIKCEEHLVHNLLLRLLGTLPVGKMEWTIVDPVKMGNSIAPFKPLLDIEKLVPEKKCLTRSNEIESALLKLCEEIEKRQQKNFIGCITDWQQYNAANKDNPLPYKVLLMFDFPEKGQRSNNNIFMYFKEIMSLGPKCGILLIAPCVQYNQWGINDLFAAAEKVLGEKLDRNNWEREREMERETEKYRIIGIPFRSDLQILQAECIAEPLPDTGTLAAYLSSVAEAYKQNFFSKGITDMWLPDELGQSDSETGITTLLGWTEEGKEVPFQIGHEQHHVLLAGRSGSGKSNLLHVLIHGLLHRYNADELNLYLLDYKDGVEFNKYNNVNSAVPQIKFIATVNDIEYGRTVLEHFCGELERRNELFKTKGVSDIAQYRAQCRESTGEKLPRVILIMDEFQVLFGGDNALTNSIHKNFDTLFRKGRSAGIHIILATQTLSGLSNVTNFDTLLRNIGVRIALNCDEMDSYRILANNNREAADLAMKKEGIYNDKGGEKSGNIRFNIPYADPAMMPEHLGSIADSALQKSVIKVFDGTKLPPLPAEDFFTANIKAPQMMLGEELTFEAEPFVFEWKPAKDKHLCIAGNDDEGTFRRAMLRSLLICAKHNKMFDNIVYYHSDSYRQPAVSDFDGVTMRDHTWDGDISELVSDFTAKRSLFIIDALDDAEMFYPPKPAFGVKKEETATPADSLKTLLEKGSRHGSFVIAFVDDWNNFVKNCKDYQDFFGICIGFQMNESDAGKLVNGNTGLGFKGLADGNKAVFVDKKRNIQTLFRPFVDYCFLPNTF